MFQWSENQQVLKAKLMVDKKILICAKSFAPNPALALSADHELP